MRSTGIFWLLAVLVFGALFASGFVFLGSEPGKFWLIETVALVALVFFILLYRRLLRPYKIILNGMELLKEQDFSTRLRTLGNSEADTVIDVFNRMISRLKDERLQVREKNQFLDLLIQATPQGIVILDFDENIAEINPAATRLLGIPDPETVKGKRLGDAGFLLSPELAGLDKGETRVVRTQQQGIYRCTRSWFVDRGFDRPFILVEELTEELRRIEKQSYDTLIRMMSHEVNNSVAAIGATLNVVADILRQDGDKNWEGVLPVVDASFGRCGSLAAFTKNLAEVVKIPEPDPSPVPLERLADSAVRLSSAECLRRNIGLKFIPSDTQATVNADPVQMEQVLLNIIKNACESIGRDGEITVRTHSDPVSIEIEDNGKGIGPEATGKIFTPFYSTKPDGQGIGLMFVKEVLSNHGCRFSLTTADNKLTVFRIVF